VIIGTALAVLVGASAAYASFFNSYTAGFTFTPAKAGTAKKPVPIKFVENLGANAPAGDRAAALTDIKATIYGLVSDGKDFPKCSDAIISTAPKFDANCPKGSLVATGLVHSLIGSATNPSQSVGFHCNPNLHVYNAGQGKLIFFFTATSPTQCGGLKTGATAPYNATVRRVGKNLVTNVPLPTDVSTAVAGNPGYYGSLIAQSLTWLKVTKHVHGKTVAATASIGCKNGRRPWKVQYTAHNYETTAGVPGSAFVETVSGSSKC
jgi:hypothetical protein